MFPEYTLPVFACASAIAAWRHYEATLNLLREFDTANLADASWEDLVYQELTQAIAAKCQNYIYKYTEQKLCLGSVLFDRSTKVIKRSDNAILLLPKLC